MRFSQLMASFVVSALVFGSAVFADTVSIGASKDNTLFEDLTGALSNGLGPHTYAGLAGATDQRRAVMAFDIAGNVPAGATITGVVLHLNLSLESFQSPGASAMALHRLSADWGEGTSNAGTPGGTGAPSTTNDATWIHRFFNTTTWTTAGGDYAGTSSASIMVDNPGPYTWGSTAQLVSDVQSWLNTPANNFGWILIGDEEAAFSARRFDSREHANPLVRPELVVTFDPPVIPAMSTWGMLAVLVLMVGGGSWVLRRSRNQARPIV